MVPLNAVIKQWLVLPLFLSLEERISCDVSVELDQSFQEIGRVKLAGGAVDVSHTRV